MAVAGVAVWGYAQESLLILFTALFGFGVLASLFGPMKYGILPDHLPRERLPAANALIEGATFVAILTGTIMGGVASRSGGAFGFAPIVMAFSLACWIAALFIPASGQGAPHLAVRVNIAASTLAMLRHLRADARLWWGALVTSWFWLTGIVVLSLLPPLIKTLIGGDEATVTAYLALFTVSVGLGSALAALLARGRIVLDITVVGAALIGVFAIDLGIATLGVARAVSSQSPQAALGSALGLRAAIDLCGLALAGGLFIVPAFAAVQAWSEVAHRARTIAGVNVLNAGFMAAGTIIVALLQKQGVTLPWLFVGLGVATLGVAAAVWRTQPKP
jgi:acyl-[acyl-carrier-protein]-phospholipid O-acyltransferase/long-chain-fatty-acid--[acyl-carrier-protein] ligase